MSVSEMLLFAFGYAFAVTINAFALLLIVTTKDKLLNRGVHPPNAPVYLTAGKGPASPFTFRAVSLGD
ncbi:MAG: hypothetical protein J2P31_04750 [Blastocatellia bacterium]|nr:hypothetical protein [Blastocatellia bacterium]